MASHGNIQSMKLLLVEDDFDLSSSLSRSLIARGFEVLCCADGHEALRAARTNAFDVIAMDLGLPGLEGLEILQRLRDGGSRVPVLVLTARGEVGQRVVGLNAGADDYLTKPFDLDELVATLKALTRRLGRDGELRCGQVRHDSGSGVFFRDDTPLDLSQREAEMLRILMANVDRVVEKESLRQSVFSDEPNVQQDAVEVVMYRLRKKLVGARIEIVTLRGVGYLLCDSGSVVAKRSS